MNRLLLTIAALMLPWGSSVVAADPASGAGEVRPVIKAMREEISARPSRVLIAVEDALTMSEQAACEIVTEAITSTKADPRLVGEIVFTALQHAPAMSAAIVECAVRTSPQSGKEIEQAVVRVLGKNGNQAGADRKGEGEKASSEEPAAEPAESGKEPSGKGVAASAPAVPGDEDGFLDAFLPGSVGVGGIYLITPGTAAGRCRPGGPGCSGELSPSSLKP